MNRVQETFEELSALPEATVVRDAALSNYTRFGIGGPADVFAIAHGTAAFIDAWRIARASGLDTVVIGDGTNLIVSDAGFRGVVLKLSSNRIQRDDATVAVESGASLQSLVDFTVDSGLKGLETMTGIPGSVGAAVYGNAGAYGHSIAERVSRVRFFDGSGIREFDNAECAFHYRESTFKRHKDWIVFSTELAMDRGETAVLREAADKILSIRNKKYPPTMKCAGSIFKNFLLAELPPNVASEIPSNAVIEGKVPSAWFLERVDAKGMRSGDICVADYHANLIYNIGNGTARDLVAIVSELKQRVERRWGIPIEEEVQYVGFVPVETRTEAVTI
ncbi:MAG TPA: UDP-N-acetylmuramate dehydrogenase [Bryobacteraceae bacterium]|jgi:UDP-N-acetylmuramate dehydrogenase